MKSTLAVVVISLACLYTFFHSCHGLICYSCSSINYEIPNCENITDDEFIRDYGDKADFCTKIVSFREQRDNVTADKSKQPEDRLLRRHGSFMDQAYPETERSIKIQKGKGYRSYVFADKSKQPEDRLLRRHGGFMDQAYPETERSLKIQKGKGYRSYVFTCHKDRCNGV